MKPEFYKNKFLLIPILLLVFVIVVSQFFSLKIFRYYTTTWKNTEYMNYAIKDSLFHKLKTDYLIKKDQKFLIIFGTSRSTLFNHKYIYRKVPNTYTYNFSATVACPSYHYFWLEKILKQGIKPNYVLLETDPLQLDSKATTTSLKYSYDMSFVMNNIYLFNFKNGYHQVKEGGFSLSDVSHYMMYQTFFLYKFPNALENIRENLKEVPFLNDQNRVIRVRYAHINQTIMEGMDREFIRNFGSYFPDPYSQLMTKEQLKSHADLQYKRYIKKFKPSSTQIYFLKKFITTLKENNIPLIIYIAMSTSYYRENQKEEGIIQEYSKFLNDFISQTKEENSDYNIQFLDPYSSPQINCREFCDSYHLANQCFPELTDYIITNLLQN